MKTQLHRVSVKLGICVLKVVLFTKKMGYIVSLSFRLMSEGNNVNIIMRDIRKNEVKQDKLHLH